MVETGWCKMLAKSSSNLTPEQVFTTPVGHFFKRSPEKPFPDDAPARETDETSESKTAGKRAILCRQCGHIIAWPEDMISINAAHQHTFANPGGIVYEIGCFSSASGCGLSGRPTAEFTWFAGYFWQVAICGSCLVHLGWYFSTKSGAGFFGLIMDQLMFPKK